MILRTEKRKPTQREWRQLQRIVTRLEPRVLRGFLKFIQAIRSDVSLEVLRGIIEGDSPAELFRASDFEAVANAAVQETIGVHLREAFEASGEVAARILPVDAVFEIENPRAVDALRRQGAALVTNVTESTRDAVRAATVVAREAGLSSQTAAQLIRPCIGLLPGKVVDGQLRNSHVGAVISRYTGLVEQGFAVADAMREAQSYAGRLTQYRAMMISRTEPRIAAIAGQREAWEQTIDEGVFSRDELRREWIAVEDNPDPDDPCPRLDEQVVGMDEPFVDPETQEEYDAPPDPHPHCVCALEGKLE